MVKSTLPPRLKSGISPMITSMKSTHETVPFKHKYMATNIVYTVLTWGNNLKSLDSMPAGYGGDPTALTIGQEVSHM